MFGVATVLGVGALCFVAGLVAALIFIMTAERLAREDGARLRAVAELEEVNADGPAPSPPGASGDDCEACTDRRLLHQTAPPPALCRACEIRLAAWFSARAPTCAEHAELEGLRRFEATYVRHDLRGERGNFFDREWRKARLNTQHGEDNHR